MCKCLCTFMYLYMPGYTFERAAEAIVMAAALSLQVREIVSALMLCAISNVFLHVIQSCTLAS